MSKVISIVILNWNGRELLEKCVPSVARAVEACGRDIELIVADNRSGDSSLEYLRSSFPGIRLIPLKENLGFAPAMNIAILQARGDIIIGLNNDVIAEEGFIAPLTRHFERGDDVFAVAAKMLLWDKKTLNFGRAVGDFNWGFFRRQFEESDSDCNALYACGGAFAVSKDKFLELGGFDEDMLAFWEDLDLCYRAWKRGYRTVYEPASVVYHKFHGSYRKVCSQARIREISGENYFLFTLKNIHDNRLFLTHLFFIPALLVASCGYGRPHFARGLLRSFKRWPLFRRKRKQERRKAFLSDREVLKISSQGR